jgi:hypothetical protein
MQPYSRLYHKDKELYHISCCNKFQTAGLTKKAEPSSHLLAFPQSGLLLWTTAGGLGLSQAHGRLGRVHKNSREGRGDMSLGGWDQMGGKVRPISKNKKTKSIVENQASRGEQPARGQKRANKLVQASGNWSPAACFYGILLWAARVN